MDIRVFKTFTKVASNKHFGKAAEQLYITQAAVSARIKQLEEFYGTPLFIREKNNLKLTLAGEALLGFAQAIIEQLELSKVAINSAASQKELFNIAATPNVWDAFFSTKIHLLHEQLEGMTLGTEISVRESIHRKLDERSMQIAFLTDPIKESEFQNHLIAYFDICLVGTQPEVNPSDNYIFVDWGLSFQKEHALAHKWIPSHKTSTAMIALELLMANGGHAYLPAELVADYIDSGQLFLIDTPIQIKRPIYLTHRKDSSNADVISLLLRSLSTAQ